VKETEADQVDFLLSELLPNLPNGTSAVSPSNADDRSELTIIDRVHFLFHHMTSKVEFRIVADEEIRKDIVKFQLKTLSVSNLYKSGTLTPSYNKETGITSFNWSNQATKQGYDFKTCEPQLLLPQDIGDDVELNLSYTITFKSDGTTYHYEGSTPVADQDYTYSNTASIQLNEMKLTSTDLPLTKWEHNHHYIYTIRLRANRIDFTGQVVEWGDTQEIEDITIEE
jgi:hypothetical protein